MTLTHEAMPQDATAKAALEIPLVVIGSVDKYKHLENCEMRIENKDGCLAKADLSLSPRDFEFLRSVCQKFNDGRHVFSSSNPVVLSIFPC